MVGNCDFQVIDTFNKINCVGNVFETSLFISRSNSMVSSSQLTQSSAAPVPSTMSSTQSTAGFAFDRIIKVWEVRITQCGGL